MTAVGTPPATDIGRAFWREVLLAGGSTTVPRWAPEPLPGTAEVEVPLTDATVVALRRLADRLAVPLPRRSGRHRATQRHLAESR